MVVTYTENIDTCIRLLLSYGLEAIDAALVVEVQRQSLHGARGRPGLFVRRRRAAIFELGSIFVVQSSGPASL